MALTVRRGHPPRAMPHSGGALPPLLTAAIPSNLLACGGGLTNAGQNAIIKLGRLGSQGCHCRWIESLHGEPDAERQLPKDLRDSRDGLPCRACLEDQYGDGVSATRGVLVPSPIRFPRTKTPDEMRYSEGSCLEGADYGCVLELIYVCYANLNY